jgi:transposase InsO family protein
LPRATGKVERFIRTSLKEWERTYGMAFQTSDEHNQWLPRYLGTYNGRRCHMALGGLTPRQSLQRLQITE